MVASKPASPRPGAGPGTGPGAGPGAGPGGAFAALVAAASSANPMQLLQGFCNPLVAIHNVQNPKIEKTAKNQFGSNLNTFKMMEELFRKPNFFRQYGDIEEIRKTNEVAQKSVSFSGDVNKVEDDDTAYNVLYLIAVGFGFFYLIKNKYI